MRNKVLSLVAAAAISGSVGVADAQQPVKLTDAQLDMATAGFLFGTLGGTTTALVPFGVPATLSPVSITSSLNNNGPAILQVDQTTANSVQQNSVMITIIP
jgi:hypothetical protein